MSAPAVTETRAEADRADPFGYDPEFHARVRPIAEFLYRRYWRV